MMTIKHSWLALSLVGLISSATAQTTSQADPYGVVTNQQVHDIARTSSQELNAQLPMAIDSRTRADTSLVGPGRRLTYLFTFTYPESRSETAADLTNSQIRNSVCSTTALKLLVDNDYLIIYKYFDIDGRFISDISINGGDCRAASNNSFKPTPLSGPQSDSALASRIADGDVPAFRQALALAKQRPEPKKLAEFADMISKFVTINPEAFLRAQLEPYPDKFSVPCFAVDYYGPDYFTDSAAAAVEEGRRYYKLSSVEASELREVKELCLAKLHGG